MQTDKNNRYTQTLILFSVFCFLFSVYGCEAFRKKFVRKPKKERKSEIVVQTQEYTSEYSIEKAYKKYFLFWGASYDELMDSLNAQDGNRKKLLFSARRTIENMQQMRQLLQFEKQTKLKSLISKQESLVKKMDSYNLSRAQKLRIKSELEKHRRQIQKEFHYRDIQDFLVKE